MLFSENFILTSHNDVGAKGHIGMLVYKIFLENRRSFPPPTPPPPPYRRFGQVKVQVGKKSEF